MGRSYPSPFLTESYFTAGVSAGSLSCSKPLQSRQIEQLLQRNEELRRVWPRTGTTPANRGPRTRRSEAGATITPPAQRPKGPPRRHPRADRPTRSDRGSAPDRTCGRLPPRPHQAGRQDLQGPVAGHSECRWLAHSPTAASRPSRLRPAAIRHHQAPEHDRLPHRRKTYASTGIALQPQSVCAAGTMSQSSLTP